MTTDSEALICDCPAKNMPFGRCCKLEPLTALRAAFESTVSEWGWDTYRSKAGTTPPHQQTALGLATKPATLPPRLRLWMR